jgi:hypothetical protein
MNSDGLLGESGKNALVGRFKKRTNHTPRVRLISAPHWLKNGIACLDRFFQFHAPKRLACQWCILDLGLATFQYDLSTGEADRYIDQILLQPVVSMPAEEFQKHALGI